MFWYLVIFGWCTFTLILCSLKKGKVFNNILEIITLIVLIIFSGTRYRLGGYDYAIYENSFINVPYLKDFVLHSTSTLYGSDFLYYLFNSIIKSCGFNFYGFTLIESIVFYVLLYKAIKKHKIDFSIFIIIFLYKLFIFNTFVSMRQSLVLVIFFNAISDIIEKKRLNYIIKITICSFIHTSSLILIPLVFIDKINITKKSLIIYSTIFFILFIANISGIYQFNPSNIISSIFSNNSSLINKTNQYFTSSVGINVLSTLECYVIIILSILNFDKIYNNDKNDKKKVWLNIFCIMVPLVTFFRSFEIMIRFRDYFTLAIPFILYYFIKIQNNKNKILYLFIIIIYCFLGYYRYVNNYGGLTPYESYLTKYISIKG